MFFKNIISCHNLYINKPFETGVKQTEINGLLVSVVLMTIIFSVQKIIENDLPTIAQIAAFSLIIIGLNVAAKKGMGHMLDATVEHEIWTLSRFGYRPHNHLKKEMQAGIFIPLLASLITLGLLKLPIFLTYETNATRYRSSKRHGFTE